MRRSKPERRWLKAKIEEGRLIAAEPEMVTDDAVTDYNYMYEDNTVYESVTEALEEDISVYESATEAVEEDLSVDEDFYGDADISGDEDFSVDESEIEAIVEDASVPETAIEAVDEDISVYQSAIEAVDEDISVYQSAIEAVEEYLQANSDFYRELQELRAKDRENPRKRHDVEEDSKKKAQRLNKKMRGIAEAMQMENEAFTIKSETEDRQILDLCTSPGALLNFAIELNPKAHAVSFKLPPEQGRPVPAVEDSETVEVHLLDITMLAAHMGVRPDEIPSSHRLAKKLDLNRYLERGRGFDLVICDGLFLGSHENFGPNRQRRCLLLTQLALGLEHTNVGGTLIITLSKLESPETIYLWLEFKGFADVVFFKSEWADAGREYFYMVASNIRAASEEAIEAVEEWKREWKVATLGTSKAWRDGKDHLAGFGELGIHKVLEEYGPELVQLGSYIWERQVDGLKRYQKTET